MLVFFKVWRGRRVRVSVREAEGPVGRGCNLGHGVVGRIRVFLGLARPRDALFRPDITRRIVVRGYREV